MCSGMWLRGAGNRMLASACILAVHRCAKKATLDQVVVLPWALGFLRGSSVKLGTILRKRRRGTAASAEKARALQLLLLLLVLAVA